MENNDQNCTSQTNLKELRVGLVIMCIACNRRKVIDEWWLNKVADKYNNLEFSFVAPRLTCSCGIRGQAILTYPKTSKADFLHLYKILKSEEINTKEFAEKMHTLAGEGSAFAIHWLNTSEINKQLKAEQEKKQRKFERNRGYGNYNTKQWLDWETGISTRQGKRNRMYE